MTPRVRKRSPNARPRRAARLTGRGQAPRRPRTNRQPARRSHRRCSSPSHRPRSGPRWIRRRPRSRW
ncbi:hypothetical protein BRC75_01060 [Halobacteriales archaeon QH_7_69_31]|nr:MAG: hypothetical protein BRC75_01060 [Halobacteriales archaeon QH_7_69_31]